MIRYILDGHNIINHVPRYTRLLDRDYVQCLQALYEDVIIYTDLKKVRIDLVFDGNPPWDPSDEHDRITVQFSGSDRSADTVVIDQAEKWKGPQTVVVSDDRHIRRTAGSYGCRIMSPDQFDRLIRKNRKIPKRPTSSGHEKPVSLSRSEVQWWKTEMKRALAKKNRK